MAIKHRNKIISGIGLGMFVALLVAGYFPKGYFISGFGGTHNHKTLWDWLSLAGVPLSLAGLGFWLQIQQQKQNDLQKQRELEQTEKLAAVEREQTEKLAAIEQGIAEQNRQEEALENYFDKVSALLVEKNLLAIAAKVAKAEKDQEAEEAPTESDTGDTTTPEEKELLDVSVDVIRARTITTLRKLNSSRKTSLIRFLLEAEVITKLKLSLEGADLEGAFLIKANLEGAFLIKANLEGATLSDANLEGAFLHGANLEGAGLAYANLEEATLAYANLEEATLAYANLEGAFLIYANLEGATLAYANLEEATLDGANLEGAGLAYANLEGATLDNANLEEATLDGANLEGAKLCRTTLPASIKLDPNRDCKELGIDPKTGEFSP